MSHARLSAIAIATAIAATISMGAVVVTRPARAQTPSRAVCTDVTGSWSTADRPGNVARLQNWMNQQIAAGRTRFVMAMALCAW
jgi:hypothetical protein